MQNKKHIHPIIMNTIIDWMLMPKKKLSYFGHFLSKMSFEENNKIKTMLVTPTKNGFKLVYSKTFVDGITEPEVKFVLMHEIFHCFNFHLSRIKKYDRTIANYAMDMIVNKQVIDIIPYGNDEIVRPEGLILLPYEYNGPIVFESIYEWLLENIENEKQKSYETEELFKRIGDGDYFDEHFDLNSSDISESEIQHKLTEIHKSIESDVKGDVPGFLKKIMQGIKKRKENPVKLLKSLMSDVTYSNKRKTFRKLNRKGIPGFKGNTKTGMSFNCIADVSGSMKDVLKEVIGVVTNSMFYMNLIKIDTVVKSHDTYRNASDLKSFEFEGGGGTILQPAINYILNNKTLNKNGTIIITDGFIDELDLSKLNDVIMVYTTNKPKIKSKSKKYKEIKIEI